MVARGPPEGVDEGVGPKQGEDRGGAGQRTETPPNTTNSPSSNQTLQRTEPVTQPAASIGQ